VNLAIDGEPAQAAGPHAARPSRWWRPLAGVAVAAGVATVAIVALQQRAISPGLRASAPSAVQNTAAPLTASATQSPVQGGGGPREALSYTVPATSPDAPERLAPARLTNYIFAHSRYSSGLGQRGMLADLLIEDDEPQLTPIQRAPPPPVAPEVRVAP